MMISGVPGFVNVSTTAKLSNGVVGQYVEYRTYVQMLNLQPAPSSERLAQTPSRMALALHGESTPLGYGTVCQN
jgi:hypothetical protein